MQLERPLLMVRFRDAEGQHHTATLGSTWRGPTLDPEVFRQAALSSVSDLFEGTGCTVLAVELVNGTVTVELDAC